jgi:hypothetical protein
MGFKRIKPRLIVILFFLLLQSCTFFAKELMEKGDLDTSDTYEGINVFGKVSSVNIPGVRISPSLIDFGERY